MRRAVGVGVTYDALGRMVERDVSGAYSQIVYTPTGAKLAIMNGQTLQKAFVPLTGGSMAVYNSSGLAYYRHSDWIGSSRFASTPTRTMYSDGAYGPFGEPYAQSGTADPSFTGMNQDTVSGLYDFLAREYGIQGRWPSPDPAGLSSVITGDPQTWNRYAYVRNSPLSHVDPLGMYFNFCGPEDDCGGGEGSLNTISSGVSAATDPGDQPGNYGVQPGGGGSGSGQAPQTQLRPRTQEEYNACVQQATSTRDQAILQGRVEQAAGAITILGAIAVAGPVFSTLSQVFFKSGVEGAVDFVHAGGIAYAGGAATFIPGYLYFKGTFSDIPKAWNQYNADLVSCAGAVPQ